MILVCLLTRWVKFNCACFAHLYVSILGWQHKTVYMAVPNFTDKFYFVVLDKKRIKVHVQLMLFGTLSHFTLVTSLLFQILCS